MKREGESMWSARIWKASACALVFAASAIEAVADCPKSSLRGTWIYTATNIDNELDDSTFTDISVAGSLLERCTLEIDGQGDITSVDCDAERSEQEFQGQQFEVENDCSIELVTSICVYTGQLSGDRGVVSGNARCDFFDPNFFNLVRQ